MEGTPYFEHGFANLAHLPTCGGFYLLEYRSVTTKGSWRKKVRKMKEKEINNRGGR